MGRLFVLPRCQSVGWSSCCAPADSKQGSWDLGQVVWEGFHERGSASRQASLPKVIFLSLLK